MKIQAQQIYELIAQDFRGNMAEFSRTLKIDYSTTWRALGGKSNGLIKFIPALLHYCTLNDKDVHRYIEF